MSSNTAAAKRSAHDRVRNIARIALYFFEMYLMIQRYVVPKDCEAIEGRKSESENDDLLTRIGDKDQIFEISSTVLSLLKEHDRENVQGYCLWLRCWQCR